VPTVDTPVNYCLNDTADQLTASTNAAYSLLWYTQASGGVGELNAPTPDTSVEGTTTYFAGYVDENGCEGPRAEIVVTVSESFTPELNFSYIDTCVVSENNPLPVLVDGFAQGGTFTSETLIVDAATGEIDMTSATEGSHQITYTFDGDTETCTTAGTFTATIQFTAATIPETGFTYGEEAYCVLLTETIVPILDPGFTSGGQFSSTSLTVNSETGEIDLTSATAGTHDITYTIDANGETCSASGTFTTSIDITESTTPVTDFSYDVDVYCSDSVNTLPELAEGFTFGGVFSAESGLSINSITGEIDITSSSLGTYTINYEISEDIDNCVEGRTSSYTITILDTIDAVIEGNCDSSDYVLTVSPTNNSYNPDEVTYLWMDENGNTVGDNSQTFNVSDYASQNVNVMVPTQFSVTIIYGDCATVASFTAERLSCRDIPRGISPDGNGKNDTFDLSGYGVTDLTIFNRNGTEVYKYRGTYTNEWRGQSNNGNELPDGTYFYSIRKDDGSSVTGWVFINRAQ
jgi:gliding motility-associated-like protein